MKLQDVFEKGYSVDEFLDAICEVNEKSEGVSLDDFVLTMSGSVNKQSSPKPVIKNRKPKVKLSERCPYTIDWVGGNLFQTSPLTNTDK